MNSQKSKPIFMALAILIELAGIVVLGRALARDASPAAGIVFLSVGMIFLVIGMMQRKRA